MASRMTIENFADLIDPTFREVVDTVEIGEDMIPKFYTAATPKLPTEKGTSIAGMGLWTEFGGSITYDAPTQGYSWSSTYKEYAKGTQVENTLVLYDQFDVIRSRFEELKRSLHDTRQIQAAYSFQNAFIVDPGYSTDEGLGLCSDSHTSPVSGVSTTTGFDNLVTTAFTPAALKAIFIQGRKFKQNHGEPLDNNVFDTVVGPFELIDRADEIFNTMNGLDTAEGNKNVLKGRYTYIPWSRLTDTNDYFVLNLADFKKNHIWFDKEKGQFSRVEDFDTLVAKYRGYGIWHRARKAEWRFIIGSNVS